MTEADLTQLRTSFVRSPDGLRIAVEESGVPGAPALLFVHGFAQSRRIWRSVLSGPLAKEHLLVSFDLRGHGDSETPAEARAAGEWLAGDLEAVIDSLATPRPIVVAWSYGGVVLGEYLKRGPERVGAALLVAAAVTVGRRARELFGPTMLANARGLLSDDATTYEAAAREFLRGCTASPMPSDVLEASVSEMLRVPVNVRRALLSRDEDYTSALAGCTVPLAALQGRQDSVVLPRMVERLGTQIDRLVITTLDGVGHVPWLESPAAFEASVRALVTRARLDHGSP